MVPSSLGPVAPLATVIPLEPATPLGQVHLPQHGMYNLTSIIQVNHPLFK